MMLISHRGNVDGSIEHHENTPAYIEDAINKGFYVEVDVWGKNKKLWMGHDGPIRKMPFAFFQDHEGALFVHCKNVEALRLIQREVEWPTYFFHQNDDYTLTSNNFVWCYPGKLPPGENSIVVLPEQWMNLAGAPEYCKTHKVAGVCSDYISSFKKT